MRNVPDIRTGSLLKSASQREVPEGKFRPPAPLKNAKPTSINKNPDTWKFYLHYHPYIVSKAAIKSHVIPEEVLKELSFGERRMVHYLAGQSNHTGCCYMKQSEHTTRRFNALARLVRKGIVIFDKLIDNIAYFHLAPQFSEQKKFIIASGKPVPKMEFVKDNSFFSFFEGLDLFYS